VNYVLSGWLASLWILWERSIANSKGQASRQAWVDHTCPVWVSKTLRWVMRMKGKTYQFVWWKKQSAKEPRDAPAWFVCKKAKTTNPWPNANVAWESHFAFATVESDRSSEVLAAIPSPPRLRGSFWLKQRGRFSAAGLPRTGDYTPSRFASASKVFYASRVAVARTVS